MEIFNCDKVDIFFNIKRDIIFINYEKIKEKHKKSYKI